MIRLFLLVLLSCVAILILMRAAFFIYVLSETKVNVIHVIFSIFELIMDILYMMIIFMYIDKL